jgi:FkbM family methyltransferase
MRTALKIVQFIAQHPLASKNRPLAFTRFLSWQIRQKLNPRPVKVRFVEDSVMIVEKGMQGATGNIYTGLMEFDDMAFLLHVLRPGDTFVDVGANVGSYTILAAKNVGADVVSLEPVPATFRKLQRNVEANKAGGKVELKCFGVGDRSAVLRFTTNDGTQNHVVAENERADGEDAVEVPVATLDELLAGRQPVLLKIDVEGFEWPTVSGARSVLGSSSLKGIIIELNGSAARYGYNEEKVHELLTSYGFAPYSYNPFTRELTSLPGHGDDNTIYLKDAAWASFRLQTAKRYSVLNIAV